ncbi:GpE family phage tail protein [Brevundimonas sp.]|uniref:GpE family phage tail protein n=1 Tax=Brevundimonas sp. TaxID=1871086 RepID=UPI002898FAC2|nr:GpE family phage tail protein [Brevundimonas sp.]
MRCRRRRGRGFFAAEAAEGRTWPRSIDDAFADIAAVFHYWPSPTPMEEMTITEILDLRDRAVERWNRMHAAPDQGRR